MIYALQPLDGGPIKLGYSSNVEARRRQLEVTYGRPLALLATLKGGPKEERAIHRRFAHLRLGRTEQFQPAPDLLEFIGRPLLVGANPSAVEAIPYAEGGRHHILGIRGSEAYKEWLHGFANAKRKDMVDLVDWALEMAAKSEGYDPPPKR